jgi:hypothetical protein
MRSTELLLLAMVDQGLQSRQELPWRDDHRIW